MDPFPIGSSISYTRSTGEVGPGRYLGLNADGSYRCEYEVDGEWCSHYMVRPEKVTLVEKKGVSQTGDLAN